MWRTRAFHISGTKAVGIHTWWLYFDSLYVYILRYFTVEQRARNVSEVGNFETVHTWGPDGKIAGARAISQWNARI